MVLSKKQREHIKQLFGGRCAYCGDPLADRWHADHIKPLMRDSEYITECLDNGRHRLKVVKTGTALHPENDTFENFYPACVPCNLHKAGHTVETWRSSLQKKTEELIRDSSAYRHAKRFGLVVETGINVEFYFERVGKNLT